MPDEQQTTQQTTQAPAPIDLTGIGKPIAEPTEQMASKADLLAALRDAKEEPAGAAPAASPAEPTTTPVADAQAPAATATTSIAEAAPAASGATASEPRIAAVIRAREEAQKKRQEAVDDAARIRQEADAYRAQAETEMRAKVQAEIEGERARFREQFDKSPLGAIEANGIPRERLVDEVAREGTPEWRMIQAERAERTKLAADFAEMKRWREEQSKLQEQSQTQQRVYAKQQAEHAFLTQLATPEKAPNLRKLPDRVVLLMAHDQADQWREQGIPFAHSDIAEYLEHQFRTPGGAGAQQVAASSGQAPKVKAAGNGSRTLTAESGSERRASPKPLDEISDPQERRQALIEALREAAPAAVDD